MLTEMAGYLAPLLMIAAVVLGIFGSGEKLSIWLERVTAQYLQGVSSARDRFFLQASEETIAMGLIAGAVGLGLFWFLLGGTVMESIFAVFAGLLIPGIAVRVMWRQRINQMREQIEPALGLMANRWRTFPDLAMSFRAVEDHMDAPLADEFKFVLREMKMGRTMDEALRLLEKRVPIRPVSLFCVGIRQALPLGGNIAAVLDQIGAAVRESNRLDLFIESKTAAGRFQAYVLAAMPVLIGYGMSKVDPASMDALFNTEMGNLLLGIVVIFDVAGLLIALKIVNIKT